MAEKRLNCGINKTVIMATKITVPDIGDFENVEIIEILTKPGAVIKKNDPVVTLESDKSSVEVPSPFAGKISSIEVKIGDKVSKGSVLAVIESEKVKTSTEPIKQKEGKIKLSPYFCRFFHTKHTGVFASRIISSFTFASMGSSRVSKEAETFKELEFWGLGCCFSGKIEQTLNNRPKTAVFG